MTLLRNVYAVAAFPGFSGELLHHTTEERLRLEQLKAILPRAGFHPSKVKQAFYQAVQPLAFAAKAFVILLPTLLAWHTAINQQFAQLTKRGQRCSKFVRDSRNEVRLESR